MPSSADVDAAISAFQQGLPICLFDSEFREGETDLLFAASKVGTAAIRRLRQDCGGLLFLAIGHEVGELFGLPYLQDLHTDSALSAKHPVLSELITDDLQYDTRSAFTLSLNHRDTYTGITDSDRTLTTRRFAELSEELLTSAASEDEARRRLGAEFRTPGHIPVCREQEGGLTKREGHTELAVALARLCGLVPIVIGAGMLEPDGDEALSVAAARAWASAEVIPFISGDALKAAMLQD